MNKNGENEVNEIGNHDAILVENRGTTRVDWKNVRGHSWSDALYQIAVNYLKGNKDSIKKLSRKQRELFLRRMKYYTLEDENLVLVDYDTPPYINQNIVYNGPIPVVYKVVKNSKIESTLQNFIDRPELHAISADSLYDKVIRYNLLGISRNSVDNFLKGQHLIRKVNKAPYVPIIQSFRPTFPFEYWQMDFMDFSKNAAENGMKQQNKGYTYVLVIIDIFSKFIYLYPTKQKSSAWVSNVLRKIFLSGDYPQKIGSDNDKAFKSKEVTDLLNHFGVKPIYGKPHSPQTQGFVENKNKQIKRSIALYMTKYGDDVFYDTLDSIAFSINTTRSSVTRLTPFEVHRGRSVNITGYVKETEAERLERTKLEMEHKSKFKHGEAADAQIENMYTKMQKDLDNKRVEIVRRRIHETANKREEKIIEKTEEFNVGDFVHIATWTQRGRDEIQMNQLRLQNKRFNGEVVVIKLKNPIYRYHEADPVSRKQKEEITDLTVYPKSMFRKTLLVRKKWEWSGFPERNFNLEVNANAPDVKQAVTGDKLDGASLFYILNKHIDKNSVYYTIVYPQPHTDYRWNVIRQINSKDDQWSSKFHAGSLMKATQENIDNYYTNRHTKRPDFGFIALNNRNGLYRVPRLDTPDGPARPDGPTPAEPDRPDSPVPKQKTPTPSKKAKLPDVVTSVKSSEVQRLLSWKEKENGEYETFAEYRRRVHTALSLTDLRSLKTVSVTSHIRNKKKKGTPVPTIEYWASYVEILENENGEEYNRETFKSSIGHVLMMYTKGSVPLKNDHERRKSQLTTFYIYFPDTEGKNKVFFYPLDPDMYLKGQTEGSWKFTNVTKWW